MHLACDLVWQFCCLVGIQCLQAGAESAPALTPWDAARSSSAATIDSIKASSVENAMGCVHMVCQQLPVVKLPAAACAETSAPFNGRLPRSLHSVQQAGCATSLWHKNALAGCAAQSFGMIPCLLIGALRVLHQACLGLGLLCHSSVSPHSLWPACILQACSH
jgi:hypothetical protein